MCQIWGYIYVARSYDQMFLSFICKMGTKRALALKSPRDSYLKRWTYSTSCVGSLTACEIKAAGTEVWGEQGFVERGLPGASASSDPGSSQIWRRDQLGGHGGQPRTTEVNLA